MARLLTELVSGAAAPFDAVHADQLCEDVCRMRNWCLTWHRLGP
ncbi:MAG: hypothetical protein R2854_02850 [Caldilineaceae bacterium]